MSTTAPKVTPYMSDKRGLPYGTPAGRQPSWDSVHALTDSMQKMNVRGPPAPGAPKQRRGSQSDSSSESAAIVTPVPSKDVESVNGKDASKAQAVQLHGNQLQAQHVTPGYQYRGPMAPGALGKPDEVLQVDYNLQPRHFIPGSMTSPPLMNNGPAPRPNPPSSFAQNSQNGPNGPLSNFPTVPQPPNLANFYGQNGPNAGYPTTTPSVADKAAQDIANQIAINNALQGLNVQQPPLNPAALAAAAAAAGYNPPMLPGLYSNPLYGAGGQTPGAPQFYPGQEGVAQAVANAVASLPPAAFHAALQQAGLAAYPMSGIPGQNQGGPSANNRKLGLYKTELCRSWEEKGTCRYGPKCQFAHGDEEIKRVQRHPKVCRSLAR
jgi:Zinc finger C-x8-C-x5-C-x3-H type (and similar)